MQSSSLYLLLFICTTEGRARKSAFDSFFSAVQAAHHKAAFGRELQDMLPGATSLISDVMEMATETVHECFDIPANESRPFDFFLQDTSDVVSELVDPFVQAVSHKCTKSQEGAMKEALSRFQKCSQFSMESFIELLPSALVGNTIHCLPWIYAIVNEYMESPLVEVTEASNYFSLPGAKECIEAEHGINLVSFATFKFMVQPGLMRTCMQDLFESAPDCTQDIWPVPVVGRWLKSLSCTYMKAVNLLEDFCEPALLFLDDSLPSIEDMDGAVCGEVFDLSEDILSMNVPLPDICQHVEGNSLIMDVKARYELFREKCALGLPWENVLSKSFEDPYDDKSSSKPPQSLGSVEPFPEESSNNQSTEAVRQSLGGFFGGVVASVLVLATVIVFRKSRRKSETQTRYSSFDLQNNDLELT